MQKELLVAQLVRDEGIRLRPYLDTVGKTTIGVGRNLTDVGITYAEAVVLLNNDIDRTLRALDNALPWWLSLDEVRQRVLANMAFNLGIGGLLTFHNTLRAIASADWPRAAAGMRASKWARQVGARAERLAKAMESGWD